MPQQPQIFDPNEFGNAGGQIFDPNEFAPKQQAPEPSWYDTAASYIPQPVKSVWDAANKPLTDYLTDSAGNQILDPKAAANYYDVPSEDDWKIPFSGGATWRGLGAGMLEGAGDVVRGLSSPLNLATLGAFKGASTLAESAPAAARGLQMVGKGLSAPVALQGSATALNPNATTGERLFGAATAAGGIAGMRAPMPSAKPVGAGALEGQLPVKQPAAPIEPTPEAMPVQEPNAAAPMSTLWRGGHMEHQTENPFWKTPDGQPSRYFTTDRAQAENFSNMRNQPLWKLDIPPDELAAYGQPSGGPTDIYNLPMEVARRAQMERGVQPETPVAATNEGGYNQDAQRQQMLDLVKERMPTDKAGHEAYLENERRTTQGESPTGQERRAFDPNTLQGLEKTQPPELEFVNPTTHEIRPASQAEPGDIPLPPANAEPPMPVRRAGGRMNAPNLGLPTAPDKALSKTTFTDWIRELAKGESGELDLSAFNRRKPSTPEELKSEQEAPIHDEYSPESVRGRYANLRTAVSLENRTFIDGLPDDALVNFIERQSRNPNYNTETGRNMLDYARNTVQRRAIGDEGYQPRPGDDFTGMEPHQVVQRVYENTRGITDDTIRSTREEVAAPQREDFSRSNINDMYDTQGGVEQLHDWPTNELHRLVDENRRILMHSEDIERARNYAQGILNERYRIGRAGPENTRDTLNSYGRMSESTPELPPSEQTILDRINERYDNPESAQQRFVESYATIAEQVRGMTPDEVRNFIREMRDDLYPQDIEALITEITRQNPRESTSGSAWLAIRELRRLADELEAGTDYGEDYRDSEPTVEPTQSHTGGDYDFVDPYTQTKGKTLEEVEAAKKKPALERLGKLIGEDRAKQLASGEVEIQFDEKPIRRSGKKKLSRTEIESWTNWGQSELLSVAKNPDKVGLHVRDESKVPNSYSNKIVMEYRDKEGNPVGLLETDYEGKAISILSVSSKLGLGRGKIVFKLLKEAYDRGIHEPSGTTSPLTKNIIDRVKRLAKETSGELDLGNLYRNINKILDEVGKTKIGGAVKKFIKDESGDVNISRLQELFNKQKSGELTPQELAEAKSLAKETQASPSEITDSLNRRLAREAERASRPKVIAGKVPKPPQLRPNKRPQQRVPPLKERPPLAPYPEQSMASQIWNTPRALQSVDLPGVTSAALRQSRPLAFTPAWFKAWNSAVKAFGSQAALDQIHAKIKQNKYFQPRYEPVRNKAGETIRYREAPSIAEEYGVKMTDLLNRREEAIVSSLAEKIPGYGRYVKASNRAYTAFLNDLRAAKFEQLMEGMKSAGRGEDVVLGKKLATFVNNATGRGSLGAAEGTKVAELLGDTLYSPRALSARLQMLNPQNWLLEDKMVRNEYIKGLARMGVSWGAFSALASFMPGVHVSMDPNSTDFGKIRIGNTRIDPGAGFQQLLVLTHRELPRVLGGGGTSSSTNQSWEKSKFKPFGKGGPMQGNRFTLPMRYLYNQMNPSLRFVTDMLQATRKEPIDLTDRTLQLALPMYVTDIADAARDDNYVAEFFAPLLSSTGTGVQTYERGSFNKPVITPSIKKLTGIDLPTTQIGR